MKRTILFSIFIFLMTFQVMLDAQTWTAQISDVSDDLKAVHFASSTVGGVVGANGAIVTTTNGGASWSPQNSGTTVVLHNIYFASNSIAWAVGNSGTILHTIDGGITWIPQTSGNTKFLFDVFFVSSTTGWVVGESGIILYTIDGGNDMDTTIIRNYANFKRCFLCLRKPGMGGGK